MRKSIIAKHLTNVALVVSLALLGLVDFTAPTFTRLAIFTVRTTDPALYNGAWPTMSYGSFGYCVEVGAEYTTTKGKTLKPGLAICTRRSVGYDASSDVNDIYGYRVSPIDDEVARRTLHLTSILVLLPVATVSCAGGLLLGLYSLWRPGTNKTIITAVIACVTFAMAVVTTACAFTAFHDIQSALEDDDGTTTGQWDYGMAAQVAASVFLFLGTVLPIASVIFARQEEGVRYGAIGR
ncbi:hypothetical protein E8E14_005070 [Neopestalotiopsis sp. 37M]|nr:hypothetical protein E8E14_005070 [Neopestalotiopsis sp. 37M]